MREYRCRIELVAQILKAAIGGETKNKIKYKTFLNHERLKDYLALLVNNGLLANDGTYVYKTTGKGQKFITIYDHLSEYLINSEFQTPTKAAMA